LAEDSVLRDHDTVSLANRFLTFRTDVWLLS